MTQVSGMVFVRLANGGIGPALAGATLQFTKEDHSSSFTATSDAQGHYSLSLPEARYYTRASHPDYQDYTSAPGFSVMTGGTHTTNFFLRYPRITTVIVVRHGEKQNPNSVAPTEPLSAAGRQRADKLRDVLFRAGVTKIWVTDTVRARDTAAPLATAFRLIPTIYSSTTAVAQDVLQNNEGDVVLVVAHSDSISQMVTALGESITIGNVPDFDNMFIVSRSGANLNVLNLQYGEDSPPASSRNSLRAMSILMVGAGGGSAVEPARLVHAAGGSGISAIFVRTGQTAMVSPLATLLGISPTNYQPTGILKLVERLQTRHQRETVVVSGTHDDLRAVIRQFGGELPILYSSDVDHLIVLTRFPSGAVRVLPLRL